jgi:hypothetical protein
MPSSTHELEVGEQVVLHGRLHPVVLAGGLGVAAFVALVATLLIRHNELSVGTNLRIVLWAAVVAGLFLVRPVLRWRRSAVIVTDRRLLVRFGALRLETLAQPLVPEGVAAGVTSVLGRLLDYGTLAIATGGGEARTLWPVAQPTAVVDAVQAAAKRLKRRS